MSAPDIAATIATLKIIAVAVAVDLPFIASLLLLAFVRPERKQ